jgi:bacteriorhodopsin
MADVQVNQTGGGSNWIWALIVVILLAVIGWFAIGQPYFFKETTSTTITK